MGYFKDKEIEKKHPHDSPPCPKDNQKLLKKFPATP
jgi:hypothetical protein